MHQLSNMYWKTLRVLTGGRKRPTYGRKPYMTKRKCQEKLQRKIRTNLRKYSQGKFSSRKQAIAVSYQQIRRTNPKCRRHI